MPIIPVFCSVFRLTLVTSDKDPYEEVLEGPDPNPRTRQGTPCTY